MSERESERESERVSESESEQVSEGESEQKGSPASVTRLLVIMASLVIIVAGLKAADELFVPFLMAVLLAIIASPVLHAFRQLGFPVWLAMIFVLLGFTGIGFALVSLVGSSVVGFTTSLPLYEERVTMLAAQSIEWINSFGLNLSSEQILKYIDPSQAMRVVGTTVNAFGGVLTNSFLIILTSIFMLLEASSFPQKLRAVSQQPDEALQHFDTIAQKVKQYLGIKTLASIATGVLVAVWLSLVGVDFPLLWGLLAFLLNYVPNIGSILAAFPAVLLALVQLGPAQALYAALGYVFANMFIGNVIEPRFMGRGLGLSTLVVFVSLVFWGWVLGPVGMFLSVPLTMAVKVALESEPQTRWIAVLLGSDPST